MSASIHSSWIKASTILLPAGVILDTCFDDADVLVQDQVYLREEDGPSYRLINGLRTESVTRFPLQKFFPWESTKIHGAQKKELRLLFCF
jgi:hypothetical protein